MDWASISDDAIRIRMNEVVSTHAIETRRRGIQARHEENRVQLERCLRPGVQWGGGDGLIEVRVSLDLGYLPLSFHRLKASIGVDTQPAIVGIGFTIHDVRLSYGLTRPGPWEKKNSPGNRRLRIDR